MMSGSVGANVHPRIPTLIKAVPVVNDVFRPNLSATMPVGISPKAAATKKVTSTSDAWARLKPRCCVRKITHIAAISPKLKPLSAVYTKYLGMFDAN